MEPGGIIKMQSSKFKYFLLLPNSSTSIIVQSLSPSAWEFATPKSATDLKSSIGSLELKYNILKGLSTQ